jgi:hypothetical protein
VSDTRVVSAGQGQHRFPAIFERQCLTPGSEERPSRDRALIAPVELRLRNSDGAAVRLRLGACHLVRSWIAEDAACEDHELLAVEVEVRVPPTAVIEDFCEGVRYAVCIILAKLELDRRPQGRLAGRGSLTR